MRSHGHGAPPRDPRDSDVDYLKTLGYERRDVAIPTLAKWIAGLFVFIFGALGIAFLVYAVFVTDEAQDKHALALRASERDVPRDLPKVQAYPRRDMVLFRRQEEQKVKDFGVDATIEQMASQGLSGPAPSGSSAPRR